MIGIVMRPVQAPVVDYEHLYVATVGKIELCKVRAKNAQHAEKKLMECFLKDLPGKVIDFNLEKYLKSKTESEPKQEELSL